MSESVQFYNENAQDFFDGTVSVDMSELYQSFIEQLPSQARVLDAGCGSGRDAKFFSEQGYHVTAFDASRELVEKARHHTGLDVECRLFSALDSVDEFDGIWTCASLLHVPYSELPDAFGRFSRALKPKGVWYLSFKYGFGERSADGRVFTDLNEQGLDHLLESFPELEAVKVWVSEDKRPGRSERWLNALIVKNLS